MNPFELVPGCLRDLQTLIADKEAKHGKEAADNLEELLFNAFGRLAQFPGMGHRRPDLTSRPYFFYTVDHT